MKNLLLILVTLFFAFTSTAQVGAISGPSTICPGLTGTYTDPTSGGTWSSSNNGIATIGSSSGVAFGVFSGAVTLTYTVGASFATFPITVNPSPAAVSGSTTVCVGTSATYTCTTTGGTWTSSNPGVATIGSAGSLTTVSTGTTNISYVLPSGCSSSQSVSVINAPTAYSVTGGGAYCAGGSGVGIGLTGSQSGVMYQLFSGSTAVGTPVAGRGSTLSFGLQTTAGNYTVVANPGTSCTATMTGSATVSINPLPTAYAVTGGGAYCSGGGGVSIGLSGSNFSTNYQLYLGGTPLGVARAGFGGPLGFGTFTTAGNYTVIAIDPTTGCVSNMAGTVTVSILPSSGTIVGPSNICLSSTPTYTIAGPGGMWTSSNLSVATIGSASGTVTAVSTGVATISYIPPVGCFSIKTITVVTAPAAISGPNIMCSTNPTTYTDVTSGGTWTSSNISVATVGSGNGIVSAVATGVVTITYALNAGCNATSTVTVVPAPAPISGPSSFCDGYYTTLTNATPGGTWSGGSLIASVDPSSGFVYGITSGVTTITYTLPGGCFTTRSETVNPLPFTIGGSSSVCAGLTITLASGPSGTWSSSNPAIGAVDSSGNVTGISGGSVTISYVSSTGCYKTRSISVIPSFCAGLPTGGAAISSASWVCPGTNVTVSLSGPSGGCGITYQWQNSTDGISFADIAGATNFSYYYTASITQYFRCRITCSNSGLFANSTMKRVVAASYLTHSLNDSLCNMPNFYVSACGVSSSFNVTTWFGDGTSVNTPLTTSGICHADVFHNYYQSGHYYIKQVLYDGISPQDSVQYTFEYNYCNTFPIRLFQDANNNCNYDNGEMSMTQPTTTQVDSNGIPVATISATSGFYYKALGPVGTVYRFHVTQIPASLIVSCPTGGFIYDTVLPDSRSYSAKNFAVQCVPGSRYDLSVHASASTGRHAVQGNIIINNSYCIPQDGTLTMYCSPKYKFTWSTPAPATISGNKITWNLHNINASAATIINFQLDVPNPTVFANWTHPGDTLQTTYIINGTPPGDVDTVNNVVIKVDTVRTSFDPNDIEVSPAGPVIPCTPLQYTIQFENTGNDTAHNIIVMDTLSSDLDLSTLTIEAASATMNVVHIKNGSQNIVKFEFPNINLLDTSRHSNSGGLVVFNIKTKPGLADGTPISNYAGIFFDDNPAVLTNTVQNTIGMNPISGSGSVCIGATDTLSNMTAGGIWSISNPNASLAGGIVTGLVAGLDTVTYTVSNACGAKSTSTVISVNTVPNTTPISGTGSVCAGSSVTLTNSNTGGTWTTTDGSVAGVAAGVVTGINAGTASIMYTLSNVCGSASSVKNITVNPLPTAAPITGTGSVCAGNSVTFSDITPGGAWTTDNAGVATVTGGLVSGVSAGSANISYTVTNGCGLSVVAKTIVVNAPPIVAPLTGAGSVCAAASITLVNTTTGGTWTTSDAGTATVTTGVVTGIAAGVADITYTVSNSCGSSNVIKTITVNPLPGIAPVTGPGTVCTGSSITLSDAIPGGTWATSNNSIATVAGGVVTGTATGTVDINYTTSNGCGNAVAVKSIIVNTLPINTPVTGPTSVCAGSSITLGDITPGGSWTTSNAGAATVSGGVVYGVSAGSVNITYGVSNSCGTTNAIQYVTVNPLPGAGPIIGRGEVCPGSTITLSNAVPGGTWSSGNPAIAAASGGIVSGITSGNASISYTVTNGCGSYVASKTITVNALPYADPITGLGTVCEGASITLSDITTGGTWSTSDASIATISAGLLHSISAGTVLVTYTVNSICGIASVSKSVLVKLLPATAAITGMTDVCVGSTTVLNDAVTGGTWSSSNNSVATVSSGTVTGLSAGSTIISYATTNDCGTIFQTKNVAIHPNPASITGAGALCAGAYEVYNNADAGGTWLSGSTSIASINTSGGAAMGVAQGVTTITYTLPTGCQTTKQITINALPTIFNVTGGGAYCNGGTGVHIGLSLSEPGIEYLLKIGNTTINSVTGTGSAIDFGLQTTEATYNVLAGNTVTNCQVRMNGTTDVSITPNVAPSVTLTKSPESTTCSGTPVTFTASSVNGGPAPVYTWKVNGYHAATGTNYTYVPVNSDVVTVTLASNAECALPASVNAGTTMVVVSPLNPRVTVVYDGTPVMSGQPLKLDATVSGYSSVVNYQWMVNQTYIAGATNSSFTSSSFANNDTVSCIITTDNICGMAVAANYSVINVNTTTLGSVNMIGDIQISPNPNKGLFTVKGSFNATSDDELSAEIKNLVGQTVYGKTLTARNGEFTETIQLDKSVANGVYLLTLRAGEQTKTFRIIVGQ